MAKKKGKQKKKVAQETKHLNKPHKSKKKGKPLIPAAWVIHLVRVKYGCDCSICIIDFTRKIKKALVHARYEKAPSVPAKLRNSIKEKYNYHCQSCFDQFIPEILTIHHIKPRWRGGTNDPDNLTCLCPNCHAKLHALTKRGTAYIPKNIYNSEKVLIYNLES